MVDFSPEFDYFQPSTPLGCISFFCSNVFRCSLKQIWYVLSSFFLLALRTVSFPLSTAFILSHKFGDTVPSFSLNSKMSLTSLFLLWPSHHWVEHSSASMCMWALCCFCCYWRQALICSDQIGGMALIQSSDICWDFLWPIIWLILKTVLWDAKKKVYSFDLGWNIL